jgi:2-polyprenyl-3-methyl-5-hydroxy-6-metoxy-1,4-benzoquinol methylase
MLCVNKKRSKMFGQDKATSLSLQEAMYKKGNKHELWWHWKRFYYIVSFLSEIFKKDQIMTFADIGCAEGLYIKHIALAHDRTFCIGADIARTRVEEAKRNFNGLNIGYIVCNIESLPFKDNSIDVVLCSEVLEHVRNYRESLAELFRVGKKYLVLSFPGHSYIYKIMSKIRLLKKVADNLVLDVGHISDVKVGDVASLLKDKHKCLNIKIAAALPLTLFEIIPSIKLVDIIDNMICRILVWLGAVDYATIHVLKVTCSCG